MPPKTPPAETETWTPKGAAAKLAYIQTHISDVEKTGVNTHHGYNYFQEHGLLNLLRPLLRQLHCAVVPSPTGVTYTREGNRAIVVGFIDFIDSEEPPYVVDAGGFPVLVEGKLVENPAYKIRAFFTNEGVDNQDKATNKALTGWMKYALQKLFAVPTEHVDDADSTEVRAAQEAAGVDVKITDATADAIVGDAADAVKAGKLDGNKFKAKLAAYGVSTPHGLTTSQAAELTDWMAEEQAKAGK